jgi:hypothetical protein
MANGGKSSTVVANVQSMAVAYGLVSSGAQVNIYKTPDKLTSTDWANVKAVRITLNFVNPFDATKTIARLHTINLMN